MLLYYYCLYVQQLWFALWYCCRVYYSSCCNIIRVSTLALAARSLSLTPLCCFCFLERNLALEIARQKRRQRDANRACSSYGVLYCCRLRFFEVLAYHNPVNCILYTFPYSCGYSRAGGLISRAVAVTADNHRVTYCRTGAHWACSSNYRWL